MRTFLIVICFCLLSLSAYGRTLYPLKILKDLDTLTFSKIPETQYLAKNQSLTINVRKSASFYILPLKTPAKVKKVSFRWQLLTGKLNIDSARTEETKEGDDAIFRAGLITLGKPRAMPWFLPEWLETLGKKLRHPPDRLYWLVAGSRHKKGVMWESPWSDMVRHISLTGKLQKGWNTEEYTPSPDFPAITGVMFGSDGDNSGSSFTVVLRDFQLQLSE